MRYNASSSLLTKSGSRSFHWLVTAGLRCWKMLILRGARGVSAERSKARTSMPAPAMVNSHLLKYELPLVDVVVGDLPAPKGLRGRPLLRHHLPNGGQNVDRKVDRATSLS